MAQYLEISKCDPGDRLRFQYKNGMSVFVRVDTRMLQGTEVAEITPDGVRIMRRKFMIYDEDGYVLERNDVALF